jgi:hypothetical protein
MRQGRILVAFGASFRRPKIMQVDLLERRHGVVGDDDRQPSAIGQAEQPLIPARVCVAPARALPGKSGETDQEFVRERSRIVFLRICPAEVVVFVAGCVARA